MRYTVLYFDNMSAGRPEYNYCSYYTRFLEDELLDICYEVLTERRESLHSDEEND